MSSSEPINFNSNTSLDNNQINSNLVNSNLDNSKPDDLNCLFSKCFHNLNLKIAFLLFLIYIILNTDVFIHNFLTFFNKTTEYDNITPKGIIINGVVLSTLYLFVDLLVCNNCI